MKTIKLTNHKITIVDDRDYDFINQWKWHANKRGNTWRCPRRNSETCGKVTHWCMARIILDAPKGKQVDHINGNPLDNRRANLRLCSQAENARNRRMQRPGKYKGVHPNNSNWMAVIKTNGHLRYIGTYKTQVEAAIAYNKEAILMFGDFARLNRIPLNHHKQSQDNPNFYDVEKD